MLEDHIALYGGSFDPPHQGHARVCKRLMHELNADSVWLLPVHKHAFLKPLTPYEHRVAMCECLARSCGAGVSVSRAEQELGGEGTTYALLQYLHMRLPQQRFAWVVGADILQEVAAWHRWDDIERMVRVVVIGREGYPSERAVGSPLPNISSSEVRSQLAERQPAAGVLLDGVWQYIQENKLYV